MPLLHFHLLEKYAGMASEDLGRVLVAPGSKTEAAFVDFMRNKADLSRPEAIKRIRSMIYKDILEHPEPIARLHL